MEEGGLGGLGEAEDGSGAVPVERGLLLVVFFLSFFFFFCVFLFLIDLFCALQHI